MYENVLSFFASNVTIYKYTFYMKDGDTLMRKKNKKTLAAILIGILCMAMLAGCGRKKTDEQKNEGTQDTQIPATAGNATQTDALPMDADGFYITNDYVKTLGETINVRVSPSTDADIYKLVPGGEILNRTGYNEEWTRVQLDGASFYVYSEYVIQTEPPEGTLPDATTEETKKESTASLTDAEKVKKIVMIDPANQAVVNAEQVEIGPDTDVTKQGASTGNVGTTLGTRESELNLTYAKLLQTELESRGYQVLLTRDTDEINLSNKDRAELSNDSEATVFVRIQMNFSENSSLTGVMAVCMPEDSTFNGNLHNDSYRLATWLIQGVLDKTACTNQGIYETDQMTAINWSRKPVALIKLGYLSNADEEAKLVDPDYQKELVSGLADGLDAYYGY